MEAGVPQQPDWWAAAVARARLARPNSTSFNRSSPENGTFAGYTPR